MLMIFSSVELHKCNLIMYKEIVVKTDYKSVPLKYVLFSIFVSNKRIYCYFPEVLEIRASAPFFDIWPWKS